MKKNDYYNSKKDKYSMSGGRFDAILSLLPNKRGVILDVGCGRGQLVQELSRRGYAASGIDISKGALAEASPFLERHYCFDLESDDWPADLMNKKFDVIIASEIIEHVFLPEQFLKKLRELLTSDGQIIVTTPNVLLWKNRLKMLLGSFRYEEKGIMDFGHVRFFTIETARKVFADTGLRIQQENHFFPNLYQRGLNWLGRVIPGFFAYHMVFLLKPIHE